MKTREWIILLVLLWWFSRPKETSSVNLTVNDPDYPEISGQQVEGWPPCGC